MVNEKFHDFEVSSADCVDERNVVSNILDIDIGIEI